MPYLELSGVNLDNERHAIGGYDGVMPVKVRVGRFEAEISAVILADGTEGIEVVGVGPDVAIRVEPASGNTIRLGRRPRAVSAPILSRVDLGYTGSGTYHGPGGTIGDEP